MLLPGALVVALSLSAGLVRAEDRPATAQALLAAVAQASGETGALRSAPSTPPPSRLLVAPTQDPPPANEGLAPQAPPEIAPSPASRIVSQASVPPAPPPPKPLDEAAAEGTGESPTPPLLPPSPKPFDEVEDKAADSLPAVEPETLPAPSIPEPPAAAEGEAASDSIPAAEPETLPAPSVPEPPAAAGGEAASDSLPKVEPEPLPAPPVPEPPAAEPVPSPDAPSPETTAEPEAETPPPPPNLVPEEEEIETEPVEEVPPAASLPEMPEIAEVRLLFAAGSSELSDTARAQLDQVAEHLLADEEQRIVLLAYASGEANQASHARRLSLTRALAVRTHFIDLGIRSSRIEVRPLGRDVPDDDPADRVDIKPARR